MKKTIKKTLAIAMTAATILAVPVASMGVSAFGDTGAVQTASDSEITYIEDHSIIDCTNRYKMDDGNFNFTIKVPRNIDLSKVIIGFTASSDGVQMYGNTLDNYYGGALTYQRSDDTSDYYEFITGKRNGDGAGINLYCEYNGGYYMATNTSNYSTVRGRGYWISW